MIFTKFVLIVTLLNCSISLINCLESEDDQETKLKEERESKEMEAFMKLMVKSSQKNLKRLIETVDIGSVSSVKCNSSWHQFMIENELNAERFSTIMEDYRTGNHEKIVKLVRPEQCLISDNGKFCQIDHMTNLTMKSKPRVFDLTYALCYPRGCSNDELNNILTTLTDSYKGSMVQVKLNVVKCITEMEDVTKMEIDTAQKLLSKMTSEVNQTLGLSKFKLPGSMVVGQGSSSPFNIPFSGSSSSSSSSVSSLPNFPVNSPDDVPMFSFEDLGIIPRQFSPIETSTPPPPVSPSFSPTPFYHYPHHHLPPSSVMSTSSSSYLIPEDPRSETTLTTPSPPSYSPAFKWPESEPEQSTDSNPLRYPDIYYSDELTESFKSFPSLMVTTPPPSPSPLNIETKFDKTRLLKMIPGLIVHDDSDD